MRTVREVLRELETDRLIEMYQEQHPLTTIDQLELQDLTYREISQQRAARLSHLID